MPVSICMIVHNRPQMTEQALTSLACKTSPDTYTLTVLDDGSDEETRQLLMRSPQFARYESHLVRSDSPSGVGAARNRCIAESEKRFGRGQHLYLSDNDVFFTPGWLTKLSKALAVTAPKVAVLGGYAHPYNGTNAVLYKSVGKPWQPEEEQYEVHAKNAVDGLSWLLTWEDWDRYGPFAEDMRDRRGSEDVAFCLKVRDDGREVASIWPHVVLNCGKTDSWGGEIPGADAALKDAEGRALVL